jgi:hypothetical protein
MMGEPPVEIPLFHLMPIFDADVTMVLSLSPTGADGTSKIVAPFAASDSLESP